MKTSRFASYGLLRYRRGISAAERIHQTAIRLFGASGEALRGLSSDVGSFVDDTAFTLGRMIGLAEEKLRRAADQRFANKALDLLGEEEFEHGIIIDPGSSIPTRRAVLAARKKLPAGCARPALEDALQTLLGTNYVGLHITRPGEAFLFPALLGDQPHNLQPADVSRKSITITNTICINLGTSQEVIYAPVDPLPAADADPASLAAYNTLAKGDKVVVEPEIGGRCEVVTVEDIGTTFDETNGVRPTFTAIFNQAHEAGATGWTMPYIPWVATQREIVVVVKNAVAVDIEQRRQVHELLERALTTVTTWALVSENATSPGTFGPFTLDDPVLGMLDANPLDQGTVP